jgi:methylmalonyl-CoA mutase C-terminal domain/subunit
VRVALEEDADVIGVSILSGAYLLHCEQIMNLLRTSGMEDVLLVLGGTVPKQDIPILKGMGVAEVFGLGTPMSKIVGFIREEVRKRKKG